MKFTEIELTILKNFSSINPSMIIYPDQFKVINPAKSVIGNYQFENPYDFEPFGIYEMNKFLMVLSSFKTPNIEFIDSKYLQITEGNQKLKFFTSPIEIFSQVPSVEEKFQKVEIGLDFDISSDKINILTKIASNFGTENLWFESDKENKCIRLTVGDDLVSTSSFEVKIDSNIRKNNLKIPVKISLNEAKFLNMDYSVMISEKITKWKSFNNVVYYVGATA